MNSRTDELLSEILAELKQNKKICLSVDEAADRLGISRPFMSNLTFSDGFPVIRIGRRVLIDAKGLDAWVAKNSGRFEIPAMADGGCVK